MSADESLLTAADLEALSSQEAWDLALGWATLNRWLWPAWLPDPDAAWLSRGRDIPKGRMSQQRGSQAMLWIKKRTPDLLRGKAWRDLTAAENEANGF